MFFITMVSTTLLGQTLAADVRKWFQNYSPATYAGAKEFCARKGGRLATLAEYCDSGSVYWGKKHGDQWAPYLGSEDNLYVQVGDGGGPSGHVECRPHHIFYGSPPWGKSGSREMWEIHVLCTIPELSHLGWFAWDRKYAEPKAYCCEGDNNNYVFLGVGYCNEGYYAGWDAQDATLDNCMAKCNSEAQCVAFSLVVGHTCSRYNFAAGYCSYRPNGKDGDLWTRLLGYAHQSYFKNVGHATAGEWVKLFASTCPESHKYVYRPSHGFDYCCKTANDCAGHVGKNGGFPISTRANCCEGHQHVACTTPPCSDWAPHRIPLASPHDHWCSHAGAVHQDVPGCGRVCSDAHSRGVKNLHIWAPIKDVPCWKCPGALWPGCGTVVVRGTSVGYRFIGRGLGGIFGRRRIGRSNETSSNVTATGQ